jgi:hypothetical protein
MYLNSFSVRIVGGLEKTSGYVEMKHGSKYSISLRNDRSQPCDAKVEIDGKEIGIFRINANGQLNLERPVNDTGYFTFYRKGSVEADKSGLASVSDNDLGLVRVTFTPAKIPVPIAYTLTRTPIIPSNPWIIQQPIIYRWSDGFNDNVSSCMSFAASTPTASYGYEAGGTGLSGESRQGFYQVCDIDPDESQRTTINIRLVEARNRNEPRPLVTSSSPIPPPV